MAEQFRYKGCVVTPVSVTRRSLPVPRGRPVGSRNKWVVTYPGGATEEAPTRRHAKWAVNKYLAAVAG